MNARTSPARLRALFLVATIVLLGPWSAAAQSLAPRPYRCKGDLVGRFYYLCLGAVRGRPGVVRELTRGRKKYLRDEIRLAARLNFTEAIRPLRALLRKPPNENLRGEIALALAALGDKQSAGAILKAVRKYQGTWSTLWKQSLEALVRLDAGKATDYAKDVVRRARVGYKTAWERGVLRKALPILIEHRATGVLPDLRRLSGKRRVTHDRIHALLMQARMRNVDAPLLRQMRRELSRRHRAIPVNSEYYVGGLGDHPDDVPALTRFAGAPSPEGRAAYDAIDRLAARLTNPSALVAGLKKLTAQRENRRSLSFSYSLLARHHAALARLGVDAARRRLLELIQKDPRTASPWVAASHALQLGLAGVEVRVSALLARGIRVSVKGSVRQFKRRAIEQAATHMGARYPGWTVALLDRNTWERWLALSALSRMKPHKGVCAAVSGALDQATEDAVHDGLVSLTVLGKRCAATLERLARDQSRRRDIRGTALEVLAMLRSPGVPGLARSMASVKDPDRRFALKPYVDRALEIAAIKP
jgi:hypothetical protein